MEKYRESEIATIFQEPMTSLDPVYKIGEQVAESLGASERSGEIYDSRRRMEEEKSKAHKSMYLPGISLFNEPRRLFLRHADQVVALLQSMRIPNPEKVANMYPHELSGGMRQRVMIAMALAGKPSLLVADEPTTALDVTTQFKILRLIKNVARDNDLTVLHVTHDLGVVAAMADYSIVMYAGMVVEQAETRELFENPMHPYTVGLLSSYPKGEKGSFELKTIPGSVPPLGRFPRGCRFHPRCSKAFSQCKAEVPQLIEISNGHFVSCFLYSGHTDNN